MTNPHTRPTREIDQMFVTESVPAVRLGSVSGRPEIETRILPRSADAQLGVCGFDSHQSHATEVRADARHVFGECASSSPETTSDHDAEI